MRPLLSDDISASFLQVRPFLLLHVPAFDAYYVNAILRKSTDKSPNGTPLPHEIWLQILEILNTIVPIYCLARPQTATAKEGYITLTCEVNLSALNFPVANLNSTQEVLNLEAYLAAPDEQHDLSSTDTLKRVAPRQSHKAMSFSIRLTRDSNRYHDPRTSLQALHLHCLFHDLTVPDIIAHLQEYRCRICGNHGRHTICPGCTGEKAQRFGAYMGCGVDLACPLCLGLDFMKDDKRLLQKYYSTKMPGEERQARDTRFKMRLDELWYH